MRSVLPVTETYKFGASCDVERAQSRTILARMTGLFRECLGDVLNRLRQKLEIQDEPSDEKRSDENREVEIERDAYWGKGHSLK
jgi:hypothetical protein